MTNYVPRVPEFMFPALERLLAVSPDGAVGSIFTNLPLLPWSHEILHLVQPTAKIEQSPGAFSSKSLQVQHRKHMHDVFSTQSCVMALTSGGTFHMPVQVLYLPSITHQSSHCMSVSSTSFVRICPMICSSNQMTSSPGLPPSPQELRQRCH